MALAEPDLAGIQNSLGGVDEVGVSGRVVETGVVPREQQFPGGIVITVVGDISFVGRGEKRKKAIEGVLAFFLGEEVFDDEEALFPVGVELAVGDVHFGSCMVMTRPSIKTPDVRCNAPTVVR